MAIPCERRVTPIERSEDALRPDRCEEVGFDTLRDRDVAGSQGMAMTKLASLVA
jgi:hypothetical protein